MPKRLESRFADRYEIRRPLGEGTTGAVYLVHDEAQGRDVVLKVLREGLPFELDLARFQRDYETFSQIEHPGIVRIHEVGPQWFTMEHVEGESLAALAGESVARTLDAAIELAEIVACLHVRGLIHRRLKPSNVRVDRATGRLKLMDFGFPAGSDLARHLLEGDEAPGAVEFMAPEQIRGFEIDPRVDVYSFGVLFYHLVTGRFPYSRKDLTTLVTRQLESGPVPPSRLNKDVTPGLEKILLSAMARDAADRFQSADELLNELVFLSGKSEISRIRTEKGRQYLFPARFVGRDRLMDEMGEDLRSALSGKPRFVLVRGKQGLGKSRVLREGRVLAQDAGALPLPATCRPGEGDALAPISDMVRQIVTWSERHRPHRMADLANQWGPLLVARIPELAKKSYLAGVEPASSTADSQAAKDFLLLFLAESDEFPLVLLLDDAHLAHDPVAEFLVDLLAHGKEKRILVVAARLAGGDAEQAAIDRILPRLRTKGLCREHELAPLSAEDLAAMLGSMVGKKRLDGQLVEKIHEVTGGNPRLAEETIATLADEGLAFRRGGVWQIEIDDYRKIKRPRLAEDSLVELLDRLEPAEKRALACASLLRERVEPAILGRLSRTKEEDLAPVLERLVQLGFLEDSGRPGEVAYAVVSQAVAEKLEADFDRRTLARLHEEVAALLEKKGRKLSDEELEDVAHHFDRARRPDEAVRYLVKSADRARRIFATERAVVLYKRALELLEGMEDAVGRKAEVLGKLGSVHNRAGNFDEAIRYYTQAINISRGGSAHAGFYLMGLGYAYYRKNKYNDALHCFKQLLGLVGEDGARPDVLNHISRTYLAKGNFEKSEAICREALELAREQGKERLQASVYNQMGEIHYMQGRWTESLEFQRQALELLPDEGDYFLKARINDGIARIHIARGDREKAYKHLEDALYQAQVSGDQGFVTEVTSHIGQIFERSLALDRAQAIYLDCLKTSERLGDESLVAGSSLHLGRLLVKRGKTADATEHLTRARRIYRDCRLPWGVGTSYLHLGEAYAAEKRWDKAKTSFALAERSLRDIQMKWMVGQVYCGVVEVLLAQGDLDISLKTLNKALVQAKEYSDVALQGRAHLKYALFCIGADHRSVAVEHFVRSLLLLEETGDVFALAVAHYEYGRYLLEAEKMGDTGYLKSAINHLRKARDLLAGAGETVWLDRASALLKECEVERINVHRRSNLAQRAGELVEELARLGELGSTSFERIRKWASLEMGDDMDADALLKEVESRIQKAESGLRKKLQDYKTRSERLLGEMDGLRDERNALWNLQQVSREINSVHDSERILDSAAGVAARIVRAERALVLVKEDQGSLRFKSGWGIDAAGLESDAYALARGVQKKVLATGEPVLTSDAPPEASLEEGGGRKPAKSILCAPLTIRENPIGVVYAEVSSSAAPYTDRDLDLLVGFANQVAVALENAFLYEELGDKQKLEQELNIANRIQAKLLPKTIPQVPGIEVYGRMIPAGKVGGDYYDFITDGPAKSMILSIGDVSGKGVPGGLVMVMARVLLHHFGVEALSTREILLRLNEILKANTEPFIFMSMLLLKWESESKRLTYTGAGHENLLIWRSRDRQVETIPAGGVVLGIKDSLDNYLIEKEIALEPGDTILLYTDGCTEAQNSQGEMFELDKLLASYTTHAAKDVAEVVEAVIGDVRTFIGDAEQHDDITVTVLKRAF